MLGRRSRIQAKPNVSKAQKSETKKQSSNIIVDNPNPGTSPKEQIHSSLASNNTTTTSESPCDLSQPLSVENSASKPPTLRSPNSYSNERVHSKQRLRSSSPPQQLVSVDVESSSQSASPPKKINQNSRETLLSPRSRNISVCEPLEKHVKQRRRFTGDEELNPKTMRMMDMIYWNPRKEKGMTRKDRNEVISTADEVKPGKEAISATPTKVAPQVKIGTDGRLVIDESSLLVPEAVNETSVWETIDEDRVSRRVTSLSFRNRLWRKGTAWTEKETELFYEILRYTGPDFGLMHEFFPSRARNELKSKFNREEKRNWAKLKEIMSMPAVLDEGLYDKAAAMTKEIEKEALAKKLKKEKASAPLPKLRKWRKRKKSDEDEWNEETADLVTEAEDIIRQMEKDNEGQNSMQDSASVNNEEESSFSIESEDDCVIRKRKQAKKGLSTNAKRILESCRRAIEANKSPDQKKATVAKRTSQRKGKKTHGYEEEEDDHEEVDDVIYECTKTKEVSTPMSEV